MKKRFSTLLLAACFIQVGNACDCIDTGSFCESIGFLNKINNLDYNIVLARVNEKDATGIKINVIHSFYGLAAPSTEFSIHNGHSAVCTISTNQFSIGDLVVFVLEFPASQLQSISDCGTYFLPVINNKLKGNIAPGITEVPLVDFADILNCGNLRKLVGPKFELFPTLLTLDKPLIVNPYYWNGISEATIRVFDVQGRLVFRQEVNDFETKGAFEIETEDWAAGIYFCQFDFLGRQQVVKIVKAS